MNYPLLLATTISAKILLVGAVVWLQLYLLRRAPSALRSRLCAVAFIAMLLLVTAQVLAPRWLVDGPSIHFTRVASSQTARVPARSFTISWITVVWAAGFLVMILRAATGRFAFSRIRRHATFQETFSGVDVRLGAVQTPVLCGVLRPVILLPENAAEWTERERRMVLMHEVTHFRHRDHWSNLFAQSVRTVLWFHPVAWWLASRMSREQELACDEAVVAMGFPAHEYAAFLLASVKNLASGDLFACAMAGSGGRSLKLRFARLLDNQPPVAVTPRAVASLVAAATLVLSVTLIRPVWSQTASQKHDQVYKMGPDITTPKLIYKLTPEYTENAKAQRIEGPVILKAVISESGMADEIEVVNGLDAGLDANAMEALSRWRFEPAMKDGRPVAVWATIQVNFRLK